MSEPVTNAQIEDVLSAVRRLVSENGGGPKPEDRDETRGKLVLTPAFRIDPKKDTVEKSQTSPIDDVVDTFVMKSLHDESEADAADSQKPKVEAQSRAAKAEDRAQSLASRIAELEAVVNQSAQLDYEPDGEEEGHDAPDAVPFRHRSVKPSYEEEADASAQEIVDAEEISEPVVDVLVEAAVAPEPETSEDLDEPEDAADAEPVEARIEALVAEEVAFAVDEVLEDAGAEASETADEWEDVTPETAPETDADADAPAMEAVEAQEVVEVEEAVEVDAEDESYSVEDDVVDAEGFAEASAAYEGEDAAPEDAFVVDEDMLREIVARLVREELQGTMGERITRNLRRMVRREIARAMTLKDMD